MESHRPLNQSFYAASTVDTARLLLGKLLVRRQNGVVRSGVITETEAYCGPHDLACHASKGRTKRTEVMFGAPGHWYVYLIYGMYHCLNVVTEAEGFPAAVLIRGVQPYEGVARNMKTDGPGKLCRALSIDRSHNGAAAFDTNAGLWIAETSHKPRLRDIERTPRIGIDYAKEYKDKPWRFVWRA